MYTQRLRVAVRARLEVQQLQRAEPCGPSELETLESS